MDNFGVPPRLDQQPQDANLSTPVDPVTGLPMQETTDPAASAMPVQPPIDSTIASAPLATTQKSNSGKAKGMIFGLIGLVIAVGLAIGAYFLGYTAGEGRGREMGKQEAQAEFQAQEAAKQAEKKTKEQLELGGLIDPDYKDETLEGEIGKQLQASDGLVLKVTNIERNYKTDDPNYKLDPSKELVKVNFILGNVQKDKAKDIASSSFKLENSTGAALNLENIASYEGKFDTVKLEPGTQMEQSIVYTVNKDEKPLKFVRTQMYRITNENKEVTMKLVVQVAK